MLAVATRASIIVLAGTMALRQMNVASQRYVIQDCDQKF